MTATTALELPPTRAPDALSDPPGLSSRRVLVTGARGFLGRHLLARLLELDAEVHAVVRPGRVPDGLLRGLLPERRPVSWHEADLSDPEQADRTVRRSDPDVVLHLASTVAGRRGAEVMGTMLENTTRAAINVMTAAHRVGNRRVVLAGSVEEPHQADGVPCSPYAAAKVAATACARLFHHQWGLPVTVLRPAMVYGPCQPDESKLLPYVVGCMLDERSPRLTSGTRAIDWVYIDDVCRAFLLAAVHPSAPGLVADIGSATSTTIADTVQMLVTLTGFRGEIGFGDLPDRTHDVAHIADPVPASELLGWRATTPLAGGLSETVRWHLARRDSVRGAVESSPGGPDAELAPPTAGRQASTR